MIARAAATLVAAAVIVLGASGLSSQFAIGDTGEEGGCPDIVSGPTVGEGGLYEEAWQDWPPRYVCEYAPPDAPWLAQTLDPDELAYYVMLVAGFLALALWLRPPSELERAPLMFAGGLYLIGALIAVAGMFLLPYAAGYFATSFAVVLTERRRRSTPTEIFVTLASINAGLIGVCLLWFVGGLGLAAYLAGLAVVVAATLVARPVARRTLLM